MTDTFRNTTVDLKEKAQYDGALRHKLAMESLGLIRTALHVQMPTFQALLDAERHINDELAMQKTELVIPHRKSFDLQIRMAKAAIEFMNSLDALADEALTMAAKEKH